MASVRASFTRCCAESRAAALVKNDPIGAAWFTKLKEKPMPAYGRNHVYFGTVGRKTMPVNPTRRRPVIDALRSPEELGSATVDESEKYACDP